MTTHFMPLPSGSMLDDFNFAIRYNNTYSRDQCPVCGETHKPDVGLWPFLGEGPDCGAVCMPCAKSHTSAWPEWRQVLDVIDLGAKKTGHDGLRDCPAPRP